MSREEWVAIDDIADSLRSIAESLREIAGNVSCGPPLCNASFMAGAACELPKGHEGEHWTNNP